MSELTVAYLSRGRLMIQRPGRSVQEIESDFARQTLQRRERTRQNSSWQSQGLWGNFGEDAGPASMLPVSEQIAARRPIRFASVCTGSEPEQVFYLLDLTGVNGLFQYDLANDNEQRLMHRNDFPARDLARHPRTGHMAMCMPREDGTVGIVVGENDGRFLRDLTSGDSLDECPAWMPDSQHELLFQSAGIARDAHGIPIAVSPYRIERANVETGDVEAVHEETDCDCLQPRRLADGTLYFIRRPYEAGGPKRRTIVDDLKDVALFPFRFLRGVYHFFNFFSTTFTGQPLMTAGGPQREQSQRARFVQLRGRVIDLHKLRQRRKDSEPPPLVSGDWQLIRQTPTGTQTIVADHVLAYDVSAAGDVLITDGRRVTAIQPDGSRHRICRDELIEHVSLIPQSVPHNSE